MPRFAYTIGLSPNVGFEVVLAGASYFPAAAVGAVLNAVGERLAATPGSVPQRVAVPDHGDFLIRPIEPEWSAHLLAGAVDYFDDPGLRGLQVVPVEPRWTIDVPDLTTGPESAPNRAWRWLVDDWGLDIPQGSLAATHLAVLRGEIITEAARWEQLYWEVFAGDGRLVAREEIRIVPLPTLLSHDPTLQAAAALAVGMAIWRHGIGADWVEWTRD